MTKTTVVMAAPVETAAQPMPAASKPGSGAPAARSAANPTPTRAAASVAVSTPEQAEVAVMPTRAEREQASALVAQVAELSRPAAGLAKRTTSRPAAAPSPRAEPEPPQVEVVKTASIAANDELDGVMIARTAWHPTPARRTASVELADGGQPLELVEGDWLGLLEVVEIRPSAVLFRKGNSLVEKSVGRRP